MRRGFFSPASELPVMTVRIKGISARRISWVLRAIQRVTLIAGLGLLLWPCFVMAESRWVQYVGAWQLAVAAQGTEAAPGEPRLPPPRSRATRAT